MDSRLPPDLIQTGLSFVITWALAVIGRITFHVQEVARFRRRFFSLHLIWELMTALAMAFVAEGITSYFDLTGKPAIAVIVVVSYLGPRGVETLWSRLQDRVAPGPKE